MEPRGLPTIWRRLPGTGGRVALTFDDCDDPDAWAEILDVLGDRSVSATFFPLGMRVEHAPELGHRTLASGHVVGSHGYDHAKLAELPPGETVRRLERDVEVWSRIDPSARVSLFRPPYGVLSESVMDGAARAGFGHIVLWDVNPRDWARPGSDEIVRRVLRHARPESIVVLHAVEETAACLGRLIDGLRRRGLEPDSLASLVDAG